MEEIRMIELIGGVPYVHPLAAVVLALAGCTLERILGRLYRIVRTAVRLLPYR